MSDKERLRKAVLEMVKQNKLTLVQAAIQCDISYRQILRIYNNYKSIGDAGLTHNSRGRQSNRKNQHQDTIIALYKTKYEGFGPTLAAEYLEKDGFKIDHETLRRWLISNNLWSKHRKRMPYRQRRERKEQFGELVQIDGSIHDWLSNGEHHCLLNMVDDATSKTLSKLDHGETTRIIFITLWNWIKLYGIPLALYVDLKNVYVSPSKEIGLSHVQVACKKLGIRIIKARSPQAKGRVERNHAVYQDRFVKELYLHKITNIKDANAVLDNGFIDNINTKFEKIAKNPQSAHRPLENIDLNQIFCWEYTRQIQYDWTVSFKNKHYQIKKEYGVSIKPKLNIIVRKHLDNTISIWYNKTRLNYIEIDNKPSFVKEKSHNIQKQEKLNQPFTWRKTNAFLFKKISSVLSNTTFRKHNF